MRLPSHTSSILPVLGTQVHEQEKPLREECLLRDEAGRQPDDLQSVLSWVCEEYRVQSDGVDREDVSGDIPTYQLGVFGVFRTRHTNLPARNCWGVSFPVISVNELEIS